MKTETKNYQLPKEFATMWVDALRSGDYKQGQNYLYNNGKYCCLGVAGCILGVSKASLINNKESRLFASVFPDNFTTDPMTYSLQSEFIKMNDSGCSFPEIADWIEANVEFI